VAPVIIMVFLLNDYISYGICGVFLCLMYYFLKDKAIKLIVCHVVLNLLFNFFQTGCFISGHMLSVIGTLIIIGRNRLPILTVPRNERGASFTPLSYLCLIYTISNSFLIRRRIFSIIKSLESKRHGIRTKEQYMNDKVCGL